MNQSSTNALDWLLSEAGAGWVFGLASVIALVITLATRKRPGRVVVRAVDQSSLVRVRADVRQRIAVTFDGAQVRNPSHFELELVNDGSEILRSLNLKVVFPLGTLLLEATETEESAGDGVTLTTANNTLVIAIPYLNPVRDHKQRLRISLFLDGESQDFSVKGSGEGWSVKHVTPNDPERALLRVKIMSAASVVLFLAWMPYVFWLRRRFGIGLWEVSWRSLFAGLPFALPLLALQVAIIRARLKQFS